MKLLCETTFFNRQCPNIKQRACKSTLAITKHPPNKPDSNVFLLLFTVQNKTGVKYEIKQNIERVHTKFINDGKVTISLIKPQQDLQIKCDCVSLLKCFIRVLDNVIKGTHDLTKIGLSSIGVGPVPNKLHPIKKLIITKRSDFPIKGLPRTLQQLTISGIGKCRFDTQILFLKNLTTLDLSKNCIKTIPKDIRKLRLIELNFSENNLGDIESGCNFEWLDGEQIQSSLVNLDLSKNQLTAFPFHLIKLKSLKILKLDFNQIKKIPFAISRMISLRSLHISNNNVETLPSTMSHIYFDTVDLSNNNFSLYQSKNNQLPSSNAATRNCSNLWELAGQTIIMNRIFYSNENLPKILVDILNQTPQCLCGRPCFSGIIKERSSTIELQAKNFIFDNCRSVVSDIIYCNKCGNK